MLLAGCVSAKKVEPTNISTEIVEETTIQAVEITIPETKPIETEPKTLEPVIIEKYPTVPMFFQTDYLYTPYGEHGSVGTHGCGIASLSMVASYLLDREILPDELGLKYGKYNGSGGSSWKLFPKVAEDYGFTMELQTWNFKEVKKGLREGKVAIANAREGSPFTAGGHFIALVGVTEDDKVIVNDPYKGNYKSTSNKELREGFANGFEDSSFKNCNQYWIFSAKDDSLISNTEQTVSIDYEIVKNENMLPYYVYTPDVVNENEKTPLIIWLHDFWETDINELAFTNISFPYMLNNWSLNQPKAYIVCPQMINKSNKWTSEDKLMEVEAIVDNFINTHNVDIDKIIIMGQGIGANGSLYLASNLPEKFSAVVALSPDSIDKINMENIIAFTRAFCGTEKAGENINSVSVTNRLYDFFNEENIEFVETSHAGLVREVFGVDEDNNGQSDIIEWALKQ